MRNQKLLILALVIILIGCEHFSMNLEESISNVWTQKIKILFSDSGDKFVIFTDNKRNLVGNTYQTNENNQYKYSSDKEVAFQYNNNNIQELGFVWSDYKLNEQQNSIWGVVFKPANVSKIVFEYLLEENGVKQTFEVIVKNNTFYKRINDDIGNAKSLNIMMYSSNNNLIQIISY
ncbi:hypothetical protein [Cohnella silvisoli]|uniref:Lipoprotein n=1 Tax=Cohnella silvisoli TaxID=2873699 RepID=A0ABV1L0P9_9BACL|nr:hypothetical protein [Cohnella silvisoli]MCD9025048.1 hypothetical protein [Cohnella silvisoli]